MNKFFSQDERLGIPIPNLDLSWDDYSEEKQQSILLYWENIRGKIPDRIAELEKKINQKQAELSDEGNFERSCQLNSEIAELASIINDLWLWYRTHQDIGSKVHQ
ncbi:ABC transporter C-terminal domain-containing protein [Robertmurraya massiliosenegalensis]|uniref:ABC transporter C-terminal domain-containing protein n=1 Tax=Robertmurraya TaxID=2837507 RepID=UPI0039A57F81